MRIVVIGAGQVGFTVVEALHREHDITVIDLDEERLAALSERFDAGILTGNGASRRVLEEAGITGCDLLIACTSRDDINIIAAIFSKKISPATKTVVRTTNEEYLDIWHERELHGHECITRVEQPRERPQLSGQRFRDELVRIALDGRQRSERELVWVRGVTGIPPRRSREVRRESPLDLEAVVANGERELLVERREVRTRIPDLVGPIADARALHQELADNGAAIVYGPLVQESYQMLEFAVRDRDGHVLGFGQAI